MAGMKSLVLACMVVCAACEDEPSCSKYHFEEKVLEKLVRMEFVMEQMKAEMLDATNLFEKVKASVDDKLTEMDRTKDDLKSSVDDKLTEMDRTKDDLIKNVQTHLEKAGTVVNKSVVVFTANHPTSLSLKSGQDIIFDTLQHNEGGGYNTSTGVFTAPIQGVYQFTVQACNLQQEDVAYAIMHEGNPVAKGLQYQPYGSSCSSATAYVIMKEGEKVWVRCWFPGDIQEDTWRQAAFMGMLVN